MPETTEQIIASFSAIAPFWDENTWNSLQAKKFDEAEAYLKEVLSQIPEADWSTIYWVGILRGIPAFRGELDPTNWNNNALPCIAKAITRSASSSKISSAYSSVDFDYLKDFHNFIVGAIPGENAEKKAAWISANGQSSLINFFIANPLGFHLSLISSLQNNGLSRLKTLPESIRSVLFSAQTPEIIKRIADQNNIPGDKVSVIADVAGLVLLGFLHPEEVADRISKESGIPLSSTRVLSESLISRIFKSIQTDIDKTYAPLLRDHEQAPATPKIIQDIGPVSMPQATSQKFTAPVTLGAKPTQEIPPTPPTPSLADKGWSKISPNDPVIKFAPTQTPPPMPKPASSPTIPPPSQSQGTQGKPASSSTGEFARFSNMKPASGAAPLPPKAPIASTPKPPAAPAASSAPAPMMLHEDPKFKTIQGGADFHISLPSDGGNMMGSSKLQTPSKAAVMDLGKSAAAPTPSSSQKVVHYTDFKPPTMPMGTGPRNVSEITGTPAASTSAQKPSFTSVPVPIPPAPRSATPPPPPVPPAQQPQGQQEKVISKDYL